MRRNGLEYAQEFRLCHAVCSSLFFPSGCSDMYYWWPSTILSHPAPAELLCTAEPKQVQRPACSLRADLQAVRSCFFSCILPSTNTDHFILAQKLKRTCRESFSFFFFLLSSYSIITNFLFNILLIGWVRNTELYLTELIVGIKEFCYHPPPWLRTDLCSPMFPAFVLQTNGIVRHVIWG